MHAACHATCDLKFGSCTALPSSSPVTEASKLVTVKVESRSQTRASIDVACGLCMHYIDNLVPYAPAATGDVVIV